MNQERLRMRLSRSRNKTSWRALLGLLCATAAQAQTTPQHWLMRMSDVLRSQEYEGTFVYAHDGRLEAIRVSRSSSPDGLVERLVSLTGERRELVRRAGEVRCQTPVGEVRSGSEGGLLRFEVPLEKLIANNVNYQISIAGQDRVAGYQAVVIDAAPVDNKRYGYRLWVDRNSGMLLGSSLMSPQGRPIEQLMFTQLRMLTDRAAQPMSAPSAASAAAQPFSDRLPPLALQMPEGFRLVAAAQPSQRARQWVYSDGLASFSVYVEPLQPTGLVGSLRRGALTAYGVAQPQHRVVVVGDLPSNVVARIARSVKINP